MPNRTCMYIRIINRSYIHTIEKDDQCIICREGCFALKKKWSTECNIKIYYVRAYTYGHTDGRTRQSVEGVLRLKECLIMHWMVFHVCLYLCAYPSFLFVHLFLFHIEFNKYIWSNILRHQSLQRDRTTRVASQQPGLTSKFNNRKFFSKFPQGAELGGEEWGRGGRGISSIFLLQSRISFLCYLF